MIRIIVDSTCDIPKKAIEHYGIEILPLCVLVDETQYIDGVTITIQQVYELMRKGVLPKTSQVNLGDTYNRLDSLLAQGNDLLYLAFSAKMSGTCEAVQGLMEALREKYPCRAMCTLDSKGGSFATGLIALDAARRAAKQVSFDALVQRCRFLIEHVEHVFVIDDLTWMIRGGRISKTLGYTAALLNIKPVLDVDDGEMEVIQKVHGRKKAFERVAQIVVERSRACTQQIIGITHADDLLAAQTMRSLLEKRLPHCRYMIEEIGAVVGVHLGIGGVGVFFFNEM